MDDAFTSYRHPINKFTLNLNMQNCSHWRITCLFVNNEILCIHGIIHQKQTLSFTQIFSKPITLKFLSYRKYVFCRDKIIMNRQKEINTHKFFVNENSNLSCFIEDITASKWQQNFYFVKVPLEVTSKLKKYKGTFNWSKETFPGEHCFLLRFPPVGTVLTPDDFK